MWMRCLFGTPWLFNIAMGNGRFIDDLLDLHIENGDFPVRHVKSPEGSYEAGRFDKEHEQMEQFLALTKEWGSCRHWPIF